MCTGALFTFKQTQLVGLSEVGEGYLWSAK